MPVSKKHLLAPVSLTLVAASLTGCVVAPPVNSAWNDPEAFLATNFSTTALNPDLATHAKNTPASTAAPFHKLIVRGKMTRTSNLDSEQAPLSEDYVSTYYPLPGGALINKTFEIFINGLPNSMAFSTTYDGLFALRTQTAGTNNWFYNGNVYTMQSTEKWSAMNPISEGTEYDFESHWGRESSVEGQTNFLHCKSGHFYPASQVNAALTGNAIDLSCEEGAAVASSLTNFTYLSDYNISLPRKEASVQRIWEYQITSIELDR